MQKLVGIEQYFVPTDYHSEVTSLAYQKIRNTLGNPYSFWTFWNHDDEVDRDSGFIYKGDRYPIGMRLFINSNGKTIQEDRTIVIYVHHEKKFGKDLSWSKAFPVTIVE